MRFRVFSVFDNAAKVYLPLFQCQSEGVALRAFRDAVNSPSHEFSKHRADFALFKVGEFDDGSGQFVQDKTEPKMIATGLSVYEKPNLQSVKDDEDGQLASA